MHPTLRSLCCAALLLPAAMTARAEPFSVLVTFGHDGVQRDWDGTIAIEGGELTALAPWKMFDGDRVLEPNGWRYRSGRERRQIKDGMQKLVEPPGEPLPGGVIVHGEARAGARLKLASAHGSFEIALSDLGWREPLRFLDGAVEVQRLPGAEKLSDRRRENDFPSLAVSDAGEVWAAWQSFDGQADTIRLARWMDGKWGVDTPLPQSNGRVWQPALALEADSAPRVFWSQQRGENWDLFTVVHRGDRLESPERLTNHPGADLGARAVRDAAGRMHVVWQGERDGFSRILLKTLDAGRWSEEIVVSEADRNANAWAPAVCADPAGRIHIAWDSYRNGNSDVWMRSYSPENGLGGEVAVASSARHEAHVAIACDNRGRVWLAWESGPAGWGKDLAEELLDDGPGAALGDPMHVEVRAFANGRLQAPVAAVQSAFPENERLSERYPALAVDAQDRVWLLFRHQTIKGRTESYSTARGRGHWASFLATYVGSTWSRAALLTGSSGRISSFGALAPLPGGGVWAGWNGEDRKWLDILEPQENHIYAGLAPGPPAKAPRLSDPAAVNDAPATLHPDEPSDLARIRGYRAQAGGRSYRILRGDLHRHSEFSRDQGNGRDGSTLDFYRYMLDAAAMDFGALTEHSNGFDSAWTWRIEKLADLFQRPGYTALYGYERTATYPFGHRNIIHTRRGVPRIDMFTRPTFVGARPEVQVNAGDLVENDTALLHEQLRETGGIAIAHTTGSTHGTDWRDPDSQTEPVVEIYQGLRQSYERLDSPRAFESGKTPSVFREKGLVTNAWEKGLRLGVIASSDHVSTHASYAMVYTEEPTREAILEAIRARRTYAATDNIVLDCRVGERLMGEEFSLEGPPVIRIRVEGTAPVARLTVIKDNQAVYSASPGKRKVEIDWRDEEGPRETSFYYVRVEQSDGQLAWSSPFWIRGGTLR